MPLERDSGSTRGQKEMLLSPAAQPRRYAPALTPMALGTLLGINVRSAPGADLSVGMGSVFSVWSGAPVIHFCVYAQLPYYRN